jgi:hypothetical protein
MNTVIWQILSSAKYSNLLTLVCAALMCLVVEVIVLHLHQKIALSGPNSVPSEGYYLMLV